jgi:hypothetical protein
MPIALFIVRYLQGFSLTAGPVSSPRHHPERSYVTDFQGQTFY